MIRALGAFDVLAMTAFRPSSRFELTALTWPKAQPENRHLTSLGLASRLLTVASRRTHLGVASLAGKVSGVVVAKARAGGLVWDVEYLVAAEASTGAELLGWVCDRAMGAGARRVFVETAEAGFGADSARRSGFSRYAAGALYTRAPGFSRVPEDSLPARPRLSYDEQGIFQLYSTQTPAAVRAAEAMTQEEWGALYPGRKLWAPSVLGDRQDFVWELASRVIGWMRVDFGQRSQSLDLMIHPSYEAYGDKMVQNALVQLSSKVSVIADVREYQEATRASLERAQFLRGDGYLAWVRQLAPRVTDAVPSVVRAQAGPPA